MEDQTLNVSSDTNSNAPKQKSAKEIVREVKRLEKLEKFNAKQEKKLLLSSNKTQKFAGEVLIYT